MTITIQYLTDIDLNEIILPTSSLVPDLQNTSQPTWLVLKEQQLVASASIWLDDKNQTAMLGNYFEINNDFGIELLNHICQHLQQQGFDKVIGPMNGDTWHSYRLVTDTDNSPAFFSEYYTPPSWANTFYDSGFDVIGEYCSAITSNLIYQDSSANKFAAKLASLGLRIRSFNKQQADKDLSAIHQLSLTSFANNYLYSPISLELFLSLYNKIVPYVDEEFFLLVEDQEKLVGYIFAIPDYNQKAAGHKIDSLIIKTLAKYPDRKYAGLGNYLAHHIHQLAANQGYNNVIHALMYKNNISKVISEKSASIFREYALYGKNLA